MDLGLKNRRVLVTGAAGGLGRAAARILVEEGAAAIVSDLDEDALAEAAQEIGGEPRACAADLSGVDGVARLVEAVDAFGGCDVLVHATGLTGAKGDPLEMRDEDFETCWTTNFMSAVRLSRALAPGMVERGWGRIVYVVSENAVQPYPDEAVYNASKAALLNFCKSASLAYGPRGVLINAVAPAFIETPMTDKMMRSRAEELGVDMDEAIQSFLREERPYLTLGRRGKPDEVAAVIALLASDRAGFVNGSAYRVDGGAVATINA